MKTDFLTVATVAYLPQALATLQSALETGQFATIHLYALDAAPGSIENVKSVLGSNAEWINVFGPDSLDDALKRTFLRSFDYYNPFEMSCLAKYVGLSYVLQTSKTADRCVFSDTDVLFLSSTIDAVDELSDKALLLTPHQLGPSTDAAEHEYLLGGWINAGFFIVNRENPATKDILNWLIHRISRRGFVAPEYGLFCDQAWVSLLPGMFAERVVVSYFPGYNVAYWNLSERRLERVDGRFKANGEALAFFHFSGFFGATSGQLTKHGNFQVPRGSVLEELCLQYRNLLRVYEGLNVSGIPVLNCSTGRLKDRIAIGSHLNGLNIEAPTIKRGLFGRVGGKVDALIEKLLN